MYSPPFAGLYNYTSDDRDFSNCADYDEFFEQYDTEITAINSDWDADARIYIEIDSAEGPCTIQGIVMDVETRDGAAQGG